MVPVPYERGRVGLLLIDTVNENFSEQGKAYDLYKSEFERLGTRENIARLSAGARSRHVPVFFSVMSYTETDYTSWKYLCGMHRQVFEKRMFEAGTWNTEFHPDLTPQAGDVIVSPRKSLDVLPHTDLELQLRQRGIAYLGIAGVSGIMAVESTARTAMERGYHVTTFTDATAAPGGVPTYEAMMRGFHMISHAVLGVDEFLEALDKADA
jgi:nicotinamidase-related amidase